MEELDYQLAVMDDDGFGCAITSSPAERVARCSRCGNAQQHKFRAAGWAWICPRCAYVVVA